MYFCLFCFLIFTSYVNPQFYSDCQGTGILNPWWQPVAQFYDPGRLRPLPPLKAPWNCGNGQGCSFMSVLHSHHQCARLRSVGPSVTCHCHCCPCLCWTCALQPQCCHCCPCLCWACALRQRLLSSSFRQRHLLYQWRRPKAGKKIPWRQAFHWDQFYNMAGGTGEHPQLAHKVNNWPL